MITLTKTGDSIKFVFDNNGHYLQNGTIEVPLNSLSLVIDDSDMVTFRKAASNDIFVSANIDEFGMTKEALITFYKENMTGGGGGLPVEEIEQIVDDKIEEVTNPINNTLTAHTANTEIHVTANEKSTWNNKSDFSGNYNDLSNRPNIPTNVSELNNDANYLNTARLADYDFVTESEVSGIVDSKQDILVSGQNIKTVNGESLVGSGNIIIDSGATPIVIDGQLDSGSTNAVANSAITEAFMAKQENIWENVDNLIYMQIGNAKYTGKIAIFNTQNYQTLKVFFNGIENPEVWSSYFDYDVNEYSWSCTQTPLDAPYYTATKDDIGVCVFTPNSSDGTSLNYFAFEDADSKVFPTYILAETTNVIPKESLADRVERIEKGLDALKGIRLPYYGSSNSGYAYKAAASTALFDWQSKSVKIDGNSKYGLFDFDSKTFGWEHDGNSTPTGKLLFTKYVIDEDTLLKTTPNFSIDVSQITGEETFTGKNTQYMKLWVFKTNADYSQPWGDMMITVRSGNSNLGDFRVGYDQNRGFSIEGMGQIRDRWTFSDFKFGDTVVVDMNGLFPSQNCDIRIMNWDGENGMVSSIDFYELWADSHMQSPFIILFDDWQKQIDKKLKALDDKEEVITKALYELRGMIENLQNNNPNT